MPAYKVYVWTPTIEQKQPFSTKDDGKSCNRCGFDFKMGEKCVAIPYVSPEGKPRWVEFYHPKCVIEDLLRVL